MPPGAKKRKAAAKKKQQQQQQEEASSTTTQINLKSNNNTESRTQEEREGDERIEIIDSSHDHDKSSTSSNSNSSSSSDDDDNKETSDSVSQVTTVTSVPNQPVPVAGDAPFIGSTANVIVENTGLMDLATSSSDPKPEEHVVISHVDTLITNEADQLPLETDEVRQVPSSLAESNGVPEGSVDTEVVIAHEEEAPMRPTHGVAQRTSWLSCCGLFDVVTGSSR